MSFRYRLIVKSEPRRSGVWEHRFEVTPGEHGIELDLKLNVEVTSMSATECKASGAIERMKLVNWPEGLNGAIEVYDAYHSDNQNPFHSRDAELQFGSEIDGTSSDIEFENLIPYKRVISKQRHGIPSGPMKIYLWIYWLSDKTCDYDKIPKDNCTTNKTEFDLKLKSKDNVCLYLKGDWINDFSTLLKRYREGNYDQKMTKTDDGCFECKEFDGQVLRLLFNYGNHKKVSLQFGERFMDVMRAADYFGANRACSELFAMETRRLIHKGDTEDTRDDNAPLDDFASWEYSECLHEREYLDLWHHAINYNFPEVVQMLARHTHWYIDNMRKDKAIWDEYCKLVAGISAKV